jgi:hypothetical protein
VALRSTAGALAGLYAFLFLPSALGLVVPAALPYLPGNAGTAILQVEDSALSPWVGLALYAAYAAAALVAAAMVLVRRDA